MGPTHARERAEIRFIPLRHFATGPWVGQDSSRLVPALPKERLLAVAPPGGQTQEKSCCGKEEGQMQTQNFLSILWVLSQAVQRRVTWNGYRVRSVLLCFINGNVLFIKQLS